VLPKKYKLLKGARSTFEGQVLGCDFETISDKDVDAILFIGSGQFHPLGIKAHTEKQVIAINPYDKTIKEITTNFEKEKYLRITKAQHAKTWAVIVGLKPGQRNENKAQEAKQLLESKGMKAYLVILDNCAPQVIDYLPFDAFVITACPRIVLDDWKNYEKPVLLTEEVQLLRN
jgi:2-(3-amino-3-carboxypropyl)histidine synthase